ncbi:ATPase, T2SS/T4P/T4SS family [Desulfobacterales bacterium HSG16]|nr:ATPase, T2SS/T4P/T4SS family [Desulfobacterales bacterium HSG16]
MVEITDKGLFLRKIPLPGFGKSIPFDEIENIDLLNGNGFVLHRTGHRPLSVKGLSSRIAQKIVSGINEILDPEIAKKEKPLFPDETDQIIKNLCSRNGIRPGIILDFIVNQAILQRATDIHFEYIGAAYRARFRIDGVLKNIAVIPDSIRSRLIACIKNSAGLASYRHDVPQEGRLTHEIKDIKAIGKNGKIGNSEKHNVELRLSVIPAIGGESIVLRLFSALKGSFGLDDLGFSSSFRKSYDETLESRQGLILLSGPGNSGKTTTIYASLRYLMSGPRSGQRAVCLEDPVEFPIECASQIEIDPQRGNTFDNLLSKVLRQDVEVIMLGEIRDSATAKIALRAALTGHLILATVHCGRAAEVPRRLIDLGTKASETAEAIASMTAQRLIRRICPHCKIQRPITDQERNFLSIPETIVSVHEGKGCEFCMNTGYFGQIAIGEHIKMTPEIIEMVRENASVSSISKSAGLMGDIRNDALYKVSKGISTLEEIKGFLR